MEAIYNLGLVNKKMGVLHESLQAFEKLHTIIPNSPEVVFPLALVFALSSLTPVPCPVQLPYKPPTTTCYDTPCTLLCP